jgi:hypothetical protein
MRKENSRENGMRIYGLAIAEVKNCNVVGMMMASYSNSYKGVNISQKSYYRVITP